MNWGTFFETLGIFGGAIVFTGAALTLLALMDYWAGSFIMGGMITIAVVSVGFAVVFGVIDRWCR